MDKNMIIAGVGLSQNISNHRKAGIDASQEALSALKGKRAQVVFAFASIQYDQNSILGAIHEIFPDSIIVGGSAAGEITSWTTVFDAVNVMAVYSDTVRFSIGMASGVSKDSFKSAANATSDLLKNNKGKKPNLVITLFDGMTGNGAALVEGVKSVLGEKFPIIGGSLGDDYRFEKTFEYYNDRVLTDSVVLLGLSGPFSFGFGIRHGWQPVGLPLKVTKAKGVNLQEVDGKPALKVYEDYFGKDASELIKEPLARMAYTYPIGITVQGSDELLIRDPVIANKKGEITMAAAIPEGSTIRLMIGDRDKAIDAARRAAETGKKQLQGAKSRFIVMFNCMARNKLLGVRCNEENQVVQKTVGKTVPMIGFYTYGEQGPLLGKKNSPAYFHNETMTLLIVGEK